MTCGRCAGTFAAAGHPKCPHCGWTAPRGMLKTSTILISAGKTDAVYHSVDQMPSPLRARLIRSTSGLNAATIVIADRRGRERIAQAIRNLPDAGGRPEPPFSQMVSRIRPAVLHAAGFVLAGAAGMLVWWLFR